MIDCAQISLRPKCDEFTFQQHNCILVDLSTTASASLHSNHIRLDHHNFDSNSASSAISYLAFQFAEARNHPTFFNFSIFKLFAIISIRPAFDELFFPVRKCNRYSGHLQFLDVFRVIAFCWILCNHLGSEGNCCINFSCNIL